MQEQAKLLMKKETTDGNLTATNFEIENYILPSSYCLILLVPTPLLSLPSCQNLRKA